MSGVLPLIKMDLFRSAGAAAAAACPMYAADHFLICRRVAPMLLSLETTIRHSLPPGLSKQFGRRRKVFAHNVSHLTMCPDRGFQPKK
jgi:hypothetical protein